MIYRYCETGCSDASCWGKAECKIFEDFMQPILLAVKDLIKDRNQDEELFIASEDKKFYIATKDELFWINWLDNQKCLDITILVTD